jgi:DNA polymerase-1
VVISPADLRAAGFVRGDLLALSLRVGVGLGLAVDGQRWAEPVADPVAVLAEIEAELRPRWVWWSAETPAALVAGGLRVAHCWDVAAVHRLLFGGWRADPALVWAALLDLPLDSVPAMGQLDLLAQPGTEGGDPERPTRPDAHLRPEWASGGWARSPERLASWAATALDAARRQEGRLTGLGVGGDPVNTARSESAAELLCTELAADGLPVDLERASALIEGVVGPRPLDEQEARTERRRRDDVVLRLLPRPVDLRNPAQVKGMLNGAGFDVPDTRSWRLEPFRGAHPLIEALLAWRKAERVATTYGYGWLDANVAGGRLRGAWTGSDGAAGRMTAQAGLHNLPAELRPAIAAEEGHVFVRADLGQIEPRILAVVSRDPALMRAAAEDDLYAPVAARLRVERPVAKVAVLAAMYGQTSGTAGDALRGLESAYPVAMGYLREAAQAGRTGREVRTYGGRLIRIGPLAEGLDEAQERAALAGRGRFARNAVIQGAAAEFFKAWAVTVRSRVVQYDARVVLCLHDELIVHAPQAHGTAVAQVVGDCLQETARRWAPGQSVRFVADTSVIQRWSQAK